MFIREDIDNYLNDICCADDLIDLIEEYKLTEEEFICYLNENLIHSSIQKIRKYLAPKLSKLGNKLEKRGYRYAASVLHKKSSNMYKKLGGPINSIKSAKYELKSKVNDSIAKGKALHSFTNNHLNNVFDRKNTKLNFAKNIIKSYKKYFIK